jgi:hypothetical protein
MLENKEGKRRRTEPLLVGELGGVATVAHVRVVELELAAETTDHSSND